MYFFPFIDEKIQSNLILLKWSQETGRKEFQNQPLNNRVDFCEFSYPKRPFFFLWILMKKFIDFSLRKMNGIFFDIFKN